MNQLIYKPHNHTKYTHCACRCTCDSTHTHTRARTRVHTHHGSKASLKWLMHTWSLLHVTTMQRGGGGGVGDSPQGRQSTEWVHQVNPPYRSHWHCCCSWEVQYSSGDHLSLSVCRCLHRPSPHDTRDSFDWHHPHHQTIYQHILGTPEAVCSTCQKSLGAWLA